MSSEIKAGIWLKKSKQGNSYFGGSIVIDGQKYWITLYDDRNRKKTDKSPDFNLALKPADVQQSPQNHTETDDEVPF